jgi:multidrug efflux pump subunit AcrB
VDVPEGYRNEREEENVSRASDIEGLEKDCASAYTGRVKDIRRITRETKAFISDSKKERKQTAEADREARVAADKKMVNQMGADTKAMASALHKKIDGDEAARKRQAKADTDTRVAADKKMKADTGKLVAGFKPESDAAGKAWGTLVKTMAEKRKGTEKKPAAQPVDTLSAKKAPVGDEAKILAVVRAKPKGVKLVEIESKTGIARIKAARVLKELIDGGRITKEELLYKLS